MKWLIGATFLCTAINICTAINVCAEFTTRYHRDNPEISELSHSTKHSISIINRTGGLVAILCGKEKIYVSPGVLFEIHDVDCREQLK